MLDLLWQWSERICRWIIERFISSSLLSRFRNQEVELLRSNLSFYLKFQTLNGRDFWEKISLIQFLHCDWLQKIIDNCVYCLLRFDSASKWKCSDRFIFQASNTSLTIERLPSFRAPLNCNRRIVWMLITIEISASEKKVSERLIFIICIRNEQFCIASGALNGKRELATVESEWKNCVRWSVQKWMFADPITRLEFEFPSSKSPLALILIACQTTCWLSIRFH